MMQRQPERSAPWSAGEETLQVKTIISVHPPGDSCFEFCCLIRLLRYHIKVPV